MISSENPQIIKFPTNNFTGFEDWVKILIKSKTFTTVNLRKETRNLQVKSSWNEKKPQDIKIVYLMLGIQTNLKLKHFKEHRLSIIDQKISFENLKSQTNF